MGTAAGKLCKDCNDCLPFIFSRSRPEKYIELPEISPAKSNTFREITEEQPMSPEKPENSVDPSEFLIYYSDPLDEGCEKLIDREGFIVYGNTFPDGFTLKSIWTSKFKPEEFLKFFRDVDQRKNWDKNVETIENLEGSSSQEFFTYMKFKKVIAISQRDSIIISNIIQRPDGILLISKSVKHDKFPIKEGIERMHIYIAGYYLQRTNSEECKTKVFSLLKANFGGSISHKLVQKSSAVAFPKLYQGMEKCMGEYFNSHTQAIPERD
jgi:hypothetical protein